MPKINQEEYEVLKELDDKWKWIARDSHNPLCTHRHKPIKQDHWIQQYWGNVGNGYKEIDDRLFQFIKWEDEEPYNIAELIEEYESEGEDKETDIYTRRMKYIAQAFSDLNSESEETEVKKDLEWLKEAMKSMTRMRDTDSDEESWYISEDALLEALDQLDEPEVLSKEWIDENEVFIFDLDDDCEIRYVPSLKLRHLLVPKQELPVIPQWVADNIESKKRVGTRLNVAMSEFPEFKLEKELDIDEHECNEIYARAWLDGFTVEEEQKYYVMNNENELLLSKNKDDEVITYSQYYPQVRKVLSDLSHYHLTEQEIKDYDERFWPFAVKAEEPEE